MATNFPTNPSNGDTHAGFTYNSTKGVWESTASAGTEPPVILTEPPTTPQELNSDGTTSTVTMTAQDPDGFDITYGIAYKTAGNALPDQLASATTINQSTGVYTFTPSTTTSDAGSFTARLSATDGIGYTTRLVNFDLSFYDITSNLLVHYNFENGESWSGSGTSITDLTSNGNDGTITNYSHSRTNLTYSSGAAVFDRQSRISIPVDVDTYSSHTVLAVMKEVSATPDRRMTMGNYNPGTSSGMFVRAGGLAGRPSNAGYVSAGGFTDSYTDGSVFTIGYTLSGGTLTPYRNGSAGSQTLSASSGHVSSRSDWGVGALYDPSFSTDEANLSAGDLYEIRIFNRVLSVNDIAGFHTYAQAEHGF